MSKMRVSNYARCFIGKMVYIVYKYLSDCAYSAMIAQMYKFLSYKQNKKVEIILI